MDAVIPILAAGGARVAAWADLLDEINVFPVADGDTGRNLKISLSPLGHPHGKAADVARALVESATGNSGNIAAAFLTRLLARRGRDGWRSSIAAGRAAAWQAVAEPRAGTMLTVFDALDHAARAWTEACPSRQDAATTVAQLAAAVRSTADRLPQMQRAGVVDAGALAMFILFEEVLRRLAEEPAAPPSVTDRFAGLLQVNDGIRVGRVAGHCVNAVIRAPRSDPMAATAGDEDSLVVLADGDRVRLHLHTRDRQATRARLARLGEIVAWEEESLNDAVPGARPSPRGAGVHVMTDAAGSLTPGDARRLGVTLLDNYLIADDRRVPETLFDHQALYRALAEGRRITTAQASDVERQQSYLSALARHDRVLYLPVGSVYTGNFAAACRWRATSGAADRFTVIDTGAASGRLGLIVRRVARAARGHEDLHVVAELAARAVDACDELLFLEQLRFLVAGGRVSKTKGFFGDLLGVKPIIRPTAEGAVKVGAVRQTAEQLPFALAYLGRRVAPNARLTVLLQFSDNETRVRDTIRPVLQRQFPRAAITLSRLSLTAGAHMGPGTWGLAFCAGR